MAGETLFDDAQAVKAIRIVFIVGFIIAAIWMAYGMLNPPSKKAYNPQKAYAKHQISAEMFAPPPDISPEAQKPEEQTEKQIEEWRAKRSDLAAQWETADMAHLAFRMGTLGMILLGWTIFETRNASNSANQTLKIAKQTSELDLQPYLGVSDIIVIDSTNRFNVYGGNQCIFHGRIKVTNSGKTPAWVRKIECTSTVVPHKGDVKEVTTPDGPHDEFRFIPANGSDWVTVFLGFLFEAESPPKFFKLSDLAYSVATQIIYDDMFSLKREGNKTLTCEHGIRFEMKNCVDSYGEEKERPCLNTLVARMLVEEKDLHPSKRQNS